MIAYTFLISYVDTLSKYIGLLILIVIKIMLFVYNRVVENKFYNFPRCCSQVQLQTLTIEIIEIIL